MTVTGAAELNHPSRTIPLGEGQRQPPLARPDSPRPTGKRQSNGAGIEIGPDQDVDEDDVRD
jgi:hypothetical protein